MDLAALQKLRDELVTGTVGERAFYFPMIATMAPLGSPVRNRNRHPTDFLRASAMLALTTVNHAEDLKSTDIHTYRIVASKGHDLLRRPSTRFTPRCSRLGGGVLTNAFSGRLVD